MTYTVKFKNKHDRLWTTLKRVKGDFMDSSLPHPVRVFVFEDESKIEVPYVEGMTFKFCSKRFLVIKQNMEKEAGQKLNVNG